MYQITGAPWYDSRRFLDNAMIRAKKYARIYGTGSVLDCHGNTLIQFHGNGSVTMHATGEDAAMVSRAYLDAFGER